MAEEKQPITYVEDDPSSPDYGKTMEISGGSGTAEDPFRSTPVGDGGDGGEPRQSEPNTSEGKTQVEGEAKPSTDLGATSSGEKITAVLPNAGWVATVGGQSVYDPESYARIMGHSVGYYFGSESVEAEAMAKERGFATYAGEKGQEPIIPSDFQQLSQEEQFKFAESHGLIPKDSMYIGQGQYLPPQLLEEIKSKAPDLYTILETEGYEAYQKAVSARVQQFEEQLKQESPELYEAYKSGGLEAYNAAVKVLNAQYEEFQQKVASGELVALPDGKYITKEELEKQPQGMQEILKTGGFAAVQKLGTLSVNEADQIMKGSTSLDFTFQDIVTAMEASGISFPQRLEAQMLFPEVGYLPPGITDAKEVWDNLSDEEKAQVLSKYRDSTRDLIEIAGYVTPAAKALLPEYTIKDVSAVEWGLSAVNLALIGVAFAPGAVLGSIAGKAVTGGLSVGGAGLVGYQTTKEWSKLSNLQRAMGVGGTLLYALPVLAIPARGIKFTSVKIPTSEGEVTAWKGLSVFNNPVLGRSGGKWIVGARNITVPEAKLILEGYKPEIMLDTKVFVNEEVLQKAGFSQTQVDYLKLTLKDRNLFAGKQSPYLAEEVLLEPTARLDTDEITVFLKQIDKYRDKVDHVDLLYGSQTVKPQLAPELRGWRKTHDLDMHSTFNLEEATAWTKETIDELNKLAGNRQYRVSPESPIRVEKLVDGKWEHINDMHSEFIDPKLQGGDLPGSKLDVTGVYSYGRLVEEPAITIEYPGIGKIDVQRLSMTGVQKADTILRVRQTESGVAFRPPERGIASPGVPKDAADFYVILRTFKGQELADEWAKSWAKAMGYSEGEASKLLPKLTKAMQEVAAETPSDLIGYRYFPTKGNASPDASPTVTLHIPSSLVDSVSGDLRTRITSPMSPYASASSIPSKYIPDISNVSRYSLVSPKGVSRSPASPSPESPSSDVSPVSSSPSTSGIPSPDISPSPMGSPSPDISPSPASPSPDVSPSPSTSPSPSGSVPSVGVPSPSPTPTPVPPFEFIPEPSKPPAPPPKGDRAYEEQIAKIKPGTVVWLQGRPTSSGGGTAGMYKILPPPYRQEDLFTMRDIPPGYSDEGWAGKGMARQSLQVIGGGLAENVENVDLGWARINIRMEGGKPEISYVQDEEANVGERSQTIGMGEGQISIEEWKAAKKEGVDIRKTAKDRNALYGEPLLNESDLMVKPEDQLLNTEEPSEEAAESPESVEEVGEGVTEQPKTYKRSGRPLLNEDDMLLSSGSELIGGKNRLVQGMAESSESENEEGEFPRRKPKNMKNWWDSPAYESRTTIKRIPERTYFGHKLLPPDLGGSL